VCSRPYHKTALLGLVGLSGSEIARLNSLGGSTQQGLLCLALAAHCETDT